MDKPTVECVSLILSRLGPIARIRLNLDVAYQVRYGDERQQRFQSGRARLLRGRAAAPAAVLYGHLFLKQAG